MGFISPESNFSPHCPQFSQSPFPNFEEKSKFEKNIEAMQAMLESQQKKLNSPIPQYFHDLYSVSPIQNDQPALKMSMECFRKSELQSQNMLDSQSS